MRMPVLPLLTVSILCACAGRASAQCTPEWDATLGTPGTTVQVRASIMHDDGNGPALYVAGEFVTLSGSRVWSVAKTYDGNRWYPLAGGLRNGTVNPGIVTSLASIDLDGEGPNPPVLVAAGRFTRAINNPNASVNTTNVAKWDGTQWSAMGTLTGVTAGTAVNDLAVFDSGSGPVLYAAGDFTFSGSGGANDIAQWDGTTWVSVGGTATLGSGFFNDLEVFDDSTGQALYACGDFSAVSAAADTANIARWDGTAWTSVHGGYPNKLNRLVGLDTDGPGGSEPMLVAIRGTALATWTHSGGWGADLPVSINSSLMINSGAVAFDDGTGPAVYLGPTSANAAPLPMAKFDGTTVTEPGDPIRKKAVTSGSSSLWVAHLGVHTLGDAPTLFAGGLFAGTDAVPTRGLLEWDNTNWTSFGPLGGVSQPAVLPFLFSASDPTVVDIAAFDLDGPGPAPEAMLIAGEFSNSGSVITGGLSARVNGEWSDVGGGVSNAIRYSQIYVDSSGVEPALYVVAHGDISLPDNSITGAGVYRWDNGVWQALGAPFGFRGAFVDPDYDTAVINGLVAADLGSGSRLFAIGSFADFDGAVVERVAQWDGASWSSLGAGLAGGSVWLSAPNSAAAFNDGTGNKLYVAGAFTDRLSRWDGSSWTVVTDGLPSGTLHVFNFDGQLWCWMSSLKRLYTWNGASWDLQSTTPGSVDGVSINAVTFIGTANAGGDERVYFAATAPTNTLVGNAIVQFDGTTWSVDNSMGRTNVGGPRAVGVMQSDGSLWFGGNFTGVGGVANGSSQSLSVLPSGGIARWACPAPIGPQCPPCAADYDNNGGVDGGDLGAFFADFEAGETCADVDGNGGVDGGDLGFFFAVFEAGGC